MGWVEANGWIGGSREGGRSVEGGRREGDHQSLRPPPPPLPPHPPSPPPPPLSPPPLALFPLRLLSARLYPVCFSLYLSLFLPFRPLSPLYTLRFPRQLAVHPLSFLRSPFLLPFAVPLAALPSLSASFALALLVFHPLSPCPLSPSVCLASSFPSFIPSRTSPFPSSSHSPHYQLFIPLSLPSCLFFSFYPSFPALSFSLSLFLHFRRSLVLYSLPPLYTPFISLRRYFELSLFLSLLPPCQFPGTCARPFHSFPIPPGKLVKKYTF